ncbi:MAG: alpha/beta hydrolase [Pseudomonadota bacterium]
MTAANICTAEPNRWSNRTGSPVLALHSSASTGLQWKNLSDHLDGRHRVIAPDLPGYGKTAPWPGTGLASVENEARAMARLIKAAGEPVHLVFHSWGGALALKIAMALPEWTLSLTLIEPAIFHLLRDADSAADRALFAEIAAVAGIVASSAAEGNPEAGMGRFVDFWNGADAWANTSPRLRTALRSQLGQVVNNFAAGFNETWTLKQAAAVTCPTLMVMGLESVPLAQRVTELLAESIPHSQLAMVAGAGHMVPLTDPHIVDPLVRSHLERAERTSQVQAPLPEFHSLDEAA